MHVDMMFTHSVYQLMLQARDSLKAYTVNINTEASQLGDTLESALEHGEKFEELVNSSKTVSHY